MLPAQDLDAVGCYRCLLGGTTGAAWGMGSTCAAATTDAILAANALIPGWCDVCDTTVISLDPCNTSCTNPEVCYDPYGMWRVDVKVKYKCNHYICQ